MHATLGMSCMGQKQGCVGAQIKGGLSVPQLVVSSATFVNVLLEYSVI